MTIKVRIDGDLLNKTQKQYTIVINGRDKRRLAYYYYILGKFQSMYLNDGTPGCSYTKHVYRLAGMHVYAQFQLTDREHIEFQKKKLIFAELFRDSKEKGALHDSSLDYLYFPRSITEMCYDIIHSFWMWKNKKGCSVDYVKVSPWYQQW